MKNITFFSVLLCFVNLLFAQETPSSLISKNDKMSIRQLIVPGFENLPLKRKLFVYYLTEAFEAGRQMSWKQNTKNGIEIRDLLFALWEHKAAFPIVQKAMLEEYLTLILSNLGNYLKIGNAKIIPDFLDSKNLFNMAAISDELNKRLGKTTHLLDKAKELEKEIFDRDYYPEKIGKGTNLLADTQTNYYGPEITLEDINSMNIENEDLFFSYPDRDKDGNLLVRKYKKGDLYSEDLSLIADKIKHAMKYANENEKTILNAHLKTIDSGNYSDFLEMNKLWVKNESEDIDFMFGFIEVYNDPLEQRGAWQSFITIKNIDHESVRRSKAIEEVAYKFESLMPVEERFKKEPGFTPPKSEGVNFAYTGGLFELITFAGINLPNEQIIRENYGSKSFTFINLQSNHGQSQEEKFHEIKNSIFISQMYKDSYMRADLNLIRFLKTEFHEILGHGSGKYVDGASQNDLKNLYSAYEEGRAEVAALYHLTDPDLFHYKILPLEYTKEDVQNTVLVALIDFFTNQIRSYENLSDSTTEIVQAHQLGRQIIFNNLLKDGVIEVRISELNVPQIFIKENDIAKVRIALANVWEKIQYVISTGDLEMAKKMNAEEGFYNETQKYWRSLVLKTDSLGIDDEYVIDKKVSRLNAFLNPRYVLIKDEIGNISDVKIDYYPKNNGAELLINEQYNKIKKCELALLK